MTEQQKQPQDAPLVWDMPKLRRWLNDGASPAAENAIDVYTLKLMENDDLVTLEQVVANGGYRLLITMTAKGYFEADRLEALEKRQAEAAEQES